MAPRTLQLSGTERREVMSPLLRAECILLYSSMPRLLCLGSWIRLKYSSRFLLVFYTFKKCLQNKKGVIK